MAAAAVALTRLHPIVVSAHALAGISYAIGAAARRNNGRVGLFEGDGSFLMHLQELEMVPRHGLRLLWCIMNDGAYGAEIHKLRADGVDDRGSAFGRADLAAIAKGFGLRGANVTEIGQIGALFDVRRRTRPRCGTSTCPTR